MGQVFGQVKYIITPPENINYSTLGNSLFRVASFLHSTFLDGVAEVGRDLVNFVESHSRILPLFVSKSLSEFHNTLNFKMTSQTGLSLVCVDMYEMS